MASTEVAQGGLDREFLGIRARILDLAAALDRLDRDGGAKKDRRLEQIQQSLDVLTQRHAQRAEQVQQVFSLPYHDNWRTEG